MNKIKLGEVYRCKNHRSGTSKSGTDWELISTFDEKGHNQITIWPTNSPITNLSDGGQFSVDEIESVSFGQKKDQNGNWQSTCSINARVVAIPDEFAGGIGEVSGEFGGENPFDNMDNFM